MTFLDRIRRDHLQALRRAARTSPLPGRAVAPK